MLTAAGAEDAEGAQSIKPLCDLCALCASVVNISLPDFRLSPCHKLRKGRGMR
jgi:hypothetical protein